jgi:chromosome segregation ATPase
MELKMNEDTSKLPPSPRDPVLAALEAMESRLTTHIDDVRTEMTSRFEQVESRIEQVHGEMTSRFEQVESRIDETRAEMASRFQQVEEQIEQTRAEVQRLEENLKQVLVHDVAKPIVRIEERLDELEGSIADLDTEIAAVDQASLRRIGQTGKRLSSLEKRVDRLEAERRSP